MDTIVVKVKDFYEQAKQMHDDGMDFVEVSLLESDKMPNGDKLPASIYLSAWSKEESFMAVDYDGIDAVEDSE